MVYDYLHASLYYEKRSVVRGNRFHLMRARHDADPELSLWLIFVHHIVSAGMWIADPLLNPLTVFQTLPFLVVIACTFHSH